MHSFTTNANQIAVAADRWGIPVKAMSLTAFAVLSLNVGTAFAQGLPAGTVPPVYGAQAFSDHTRPVLHFLGDGTVFAKLFGHSRGGQAAADHTAELKTAFSQGRLIRYQGPRERPGSSRPLTVQTRRFNALCRQ